MNLGSQGSTKANLLPSSQEEHMSLETHQPSAVFIHPCAPRLPGRFLLRGTVGLGVGIHSRDHGSWWPWAPHGRGSRASTPKGLGWGQPSDRKTDEGACLKTEFSQQIRDHLEWMININLGDNFPKCTFIPCYRRPPPPHLTTVHLNDFELHSGAKSIHFTAHRTWTFAFGSCPG